MESSRASIVISSLDSSCIERCADMYREVFQAPPWNDVITLDAARLVVGNILRAPNFVGAVAHLGSADVGYILALTHESDRIEIRELLVSPAFRRRGAAKMLVDSVTCHGALTASLVTHRDTEAFAFYSQIGFAQADGMSFLVRRGI